MVMPPHREGGQLQFRAEPAAPPVDSLAELLDWVLLEETDLPVDADGLNPQRLRSRCRVVAEGEGRPLSALTVTACSQPVIAVLLRSQLRSGR
jgi:hypothetical protein